MSKKNSSSKFWLDSRTALETAEKLEQMANALRMLVAIQEDELSQHFSFVQTIPADSSLSDLLKKGLEAKKLDEYITVWKEAEEEYDELRRKRWNSIKELQHAIEGKVIATFSNLAENNHEKRTVRQVAERVANALIQGGRYWDDIPYTKELHNQNKRIANEFDANTQNWNELLRKFNLGGPVTIKRFKAILARRNAVVPA